MNRVADIHLGGADPSATLHFCYLKVRERWPESIMRVADGRTFRRPENQRTYAGVSRAFFYRTSDAARAAALFPASQPGLQVDLADGRLRLMGGSEAAELLTFLSDQPCWASRSSGPLRALDGC